MVGTFAYSFDRETFRGDFATRQDALRFALDLIGKNQDSTPPEAVFIAKRVPLDPGSSGLAEMVLGAMRRRVRDQLSGEESTGASETTGYLLRVNEHDLAELDDEIDRVARAWLARHGLEPTQSRLTAISEHAVPTFAGGDAMIYLR